MYFLPFSWALHWLPIWLLNFLGSENYSGGFLFFVFCLFLTSFSVSSPHSLLNSVMQILELLYQSYNYCVVSLSFFISVRWNLTFLRFFFQIYVSIFYYIFHFFYYKIFHSLKLIFVLLIPFLSPSYCIDYLYLCSCLDIDLLFPL